MSLIEKLDEVETLFNENSDPSYQHGLLDGLKIMAESAKYIMEAAGDGNDYLPFTCGKILGVCERLSKKYELKIKE